MSSVSILRAQIEATLVDRVPSALTPLPKMIRPVAPTGIAALDERLGGGLPIGAITEIVGAECTGRTSLTLSFIAQATGGNKVCAWVDVSDALHPESAAAAGVELTRLLWVRCGVQRGEARPSEQSNFELADKYLAPTPIKKGLHGGGCGPHPRSEANGLPEAIGSFLNPAAIALRCAEPQRRVSVSRESFNAFTPQGLKRAPLTGRPGKPWSRMEQALRVTDLLLQGGGFSAIVLDMGGISPEHASRVPLATWFRYRAAAEKTRTSILLITQHSCAKSSAGVVLNLQHSLPRQDEATVLSGIRHRVEVSRQRFMQVPSNVIPMRKPPQRDTGVTWDSRTTWVRRT